MADSSDQFGINDEAACLRQTSPAETATRSGMACAKTTVTRNVLANWFGQFVVIISGFVIPRLINDHIGQERLGVWDFGWSLVSYFGLLTAGIGSAVSRHVAYHRATGDREALNQCASSCMGLFTISALLAAAITLGLWASLSRILPESFAPYLNEAHYIVGFFGLATALSMPTMVYHGVITGYQRYDWTVYAEAGSFFLLFLGILIALLAGLGLRTMAVLIFGAKILEMATKIVMAYRLCPELRISSRYVTRHSLAEQLAFGSKFYLSQLGKVFLYQGNGMLLVYFLGPASLAVYSRSMALVTHANKFLFEYGRVLIPTASSAQASNQDESLSNLVLEGARYSLLLSLPIVLVLTIYGGSLMRIWMGPAFTGDPLLEILAVGHLVALAQTSTFCILVGMNRHGIPAMATIGAAAASLLGSYVLLRVFHTGLLSVAICMAICITLANLIFVPVVVTKACNLTLLRYFGRSVPQAVLACIPFTACLLAARYFLAPSDHRVVLIGLGAGGLILALTYWKIALPESMKTRIRERLHLSRLKGERQP